MPNQKAIKERINGIKGTQKVTKAMKLIATIKLKQVQDLLSSYRVYQDEFSILFNRVLVGLSKEQIQKSLSTELFFKYLDQQSPKKTAEILIIFSSDRGLCGAYNLQVFKALENYLKENSQQEISIITVGKKAQKFTSAYLKRKYPRIEILKSFSNLSVNPKLSEAKEIVECLKDFLSLNQKEKNFKIKTVFSDFQNRLSSIVKLTDLNSLDHFKQTEATEEEQVEKIIFEPNPQELLPQVAQEHLLSEIFYSLLSARTSELSYRVNSMTNATENAQDLIKDLTITYNKARQASITQEIIEIVSGSMA